MTADAFKVGDRVRITGKGHPHRGQSGTISAPFSSPGAPDLQWTVSLDNWSEAAVSDELAGIWRERAGLEAP